MNSLRRGSTCQKTHVLFAARPTRELLSAESLLLPTQELSAAGSDHRLSVHHVCGNLPNRSVCQLVLAKTSCHSLCHTRTGFPLCLCTRAVI